MRSDRRRPAAHHPRALIRAVALGCLCLTIGAAAARAQTAPAPEPLEPDRPDVTNGTRIVKPGSLQVEIGGLYTHAGDEQHAVGSPMTARLGLTSWLEVRLGTDGFLTQAEAGNSVSGMGNVQIGGKLRLWASPGGVPVLSVLPTVNLPTADESKGLGSGDADFTVAFLTGTDFGSRGHVDVNYGIGAIGGGPSQPHFSQHLVSASASVSVNEHWNPYAEAFWFSRQDVDGGAVTAFDTGAIYLIGPRLALDGGVQIGTSRDAPAFSAFGGLSIVVGEGLTTRTLKSKQRRVHARTPRRG